MSQDGEIKAVATNTPLFNAYASDVHAEVNAISGCARKGQATAGMYVVCAYMNESWHAYGVATMSRMLKNICLFAEYRSLL